MIWVRVPLRKNRNEGFNYNLHIVFVGMFHCARDQARHETMKFYAESVGCLVSWAAEKKSLQVIVKFVTSKVSARSFNSKESTRQLSSGRSAWLGVVRQFRQRSCKTCYVHWRVGMSIRVLTDAWRNSKAQGGTLLVLLAIADFADDNCIAYPSISTLAQKSRLSIRGTQYALRELVRINELSIEQNAGPHRSNLFRLTISGAITAPAQNVQGANADANGATHCTQMVQPIAPKPSLTVKEPSSIARTQPSWSKQEGWTGVKDLGFQLKEAYPACDIALQFKRMSLWLEANPRKARKSNWLQFITNWLRRAQDGGGDIPSQKSRLPSSLDERLDREYAEAQEAFQRKEQKENQ